jgi:two-component system response regulator RegA
MFDVPVSPVLDLALFRCYAGDAPAQRFLVVEDDPVASRVLTRSLRARGYIVDLATDADSALLIAAREHPDFVILELKLGGASTLPLIKPLRAASPSARLCILTRYAGIPSAVEAIKLGAWYYLAKPSPVEEILFRLGLVSAPVLEDGPRGRGERRGPRRRAVRESQQALDDIEWRHIMHTLRECGGNVAMAARELKMHRRTLHRKIAAHGELAPDSALSRMRHGERRPLSGSAAHTASATAAPVPLAA